MHKCKSINHATFIKYNKQLHKYLSIIDNKSLMENEKTTPVTLNENYLEDLSYSVYVEKRQEHGENTSSFTLPRRVHSWVEDDRITNCTNCNKGFTLFLRKHHCRLCGKIFCYECSQHRANIPESLLSKDSKVRTWNDYIESVMGAPGDLHRVCITCYKLIERINQIKRITEVFKIMNLDIVHFRKLSGVCKLWQHAANYYLSIFREIQYKLPTAQFSALDKKMITSNKMYLMGHNRYLLQMLKMCTSDQEVTEIIGLLNKPKIHKCYLIMCSRNCQTRLTSFDCFNLLSYAYRFRSTPRSLIDVALKNFNCSDKEFKSYLPFLVYNLRYDEGILSDFLINRCCKNFELLNSLYWELQMYSKEGMIQSVYSTMITKLKKLYSTEKNEQKFISLLQGTSYIKMIEEISKAVSDDNKKYNEIKDSFVIKNELLIPLNPKLKAKNFLIEKIKVKNSATKPIIIPCTTTSNTVYRVMYKREEVRKDQIIMNIISLMDMIIKKEESIDANLVVYNVMPISKNSGLIEIVDDCDTVYYIQENLKSSILNYILENNDDIKIKEVRERFIKTTAAYCVITYLFGVGDRHLDNIMITKDGRLFHIDYGYILGKDPVFNNPGIRITPEMIDTIGGLSSKYYEQFTETCTKIYNCLRRNIDLIMNMLMMLPKMSDVDLTEDDIRQQIINRFKPGESAIDAKLHLVQQLERQNYTDRLKDWCHYHSKEKTIGSAVDRLSTAISSFWNPPNEFKQ